jgi:hypothetical protein
MKRAQHLRRLATQRGYASPEERLWNDTLQERYRDHYVERR